MTKLEKVRDELALIAATKVSKTYVGGELVNEEPVIDYDVLNAHKNGFDEAVAYLRANPEPEVVEMRRTLVECSRCMNYLFVRFSLGSAYSAMRKIDDVIVDYDAKFRVKK